MKLLTLITISILATSCNSQKKEPTTGSQIGEYVTSAYEDSKGNLWFGTINYGIARYDGTQLKYFKIADGLPCNRVIAVTEDSKGIYWFSTGEGVTKYDGQTFTNFRVKEDDFFSNMISYFFIDSKGEFWVGTWGGVYQFDGKEFTPFPLPYPEVSTPINKDTENWITEIKEDAAGNMWFSRDGYGVCKYDGNSFTHYLKKDGLNSNNVTEIEIDNEENLWFGSRIGEKDNPIPEQQFGKGGVNKLVNNEIISFPEIEAFNYDEIYEIHKGTSGDIWIATTKNGVFRYDGKAFKNYPVPISIMGMANDRKGNLWLAGAGGLFKINQNDEVINVTTKGSWK